MVARQGIKRRDHAKNNINLIWYSTKIHHKEKYSTRLPNFFARASLKVIILLYSHMVLQVLEKLIQ